MVIESSYIFFFCCYKECCIYI